MTINHKEVAKKDIIRDLQSLVREHKEFWVDMKDDVSPKIIKNTIKFIKKNVK